jgi:hypothetical protein
MPTVILSAKARHNYQLKFLKRQLESVFEGLDFKMTLNRVLPQNLIQVTLSGEDQNVILNYLNEEVGFSSMDLDEVSKNAVTKGYVTALAKSNVDLTLDIGLCSPDNVNVHIPIQILQAQLADGRKVALGKIAELYGFHDDLPLYVRVSSVNRRRSYVEATFADKQLEVYRGWKDSLLDRLLVLGASIFEVETAVKSCGLNRDVVNIDSLGLFEHAIVCKLGTDAKGLIPRIGGRLGKAGLSVFSPGKILEFFGD